MDRDQRFRYEMFVRVRDFGAAHRELFPESSVGGQLFTEVAAAVAAIEEHLTKHALGAAGARRVKTMTRRAVSERMKTLALVGRRVARPEMAVDPFRLPRRRSIAVQVSAARAMLQEAEKRQDEFVRFGLPPTFLGDFRTAIDDLQQAAEMRVNSNTVRREATAGLETTLANGLEVIRDLDAVVTVTTRNNPVVFAAWQAARHIEGLRRSSSRASTATSVAPASVEPPAASGVEPGRVS